MRFWAQTVEKCALPPRPLVLELACLALLEGYRVENPILQETDLLRLLHY
jgi:hypothetical protein